MDCINLGAQCSPLCSTSLGERWESCSVWQAAETPALQRNEYMGIFLSGAVNRISRLQHQYPKLTVDVKSCSLGAEAWCISLLAASERSKALEPGHVEVTEDYGIV